MELYYLSNSLVNLKLFQKKKLKNSRCLNILYCGSHYNLLMVIIQISSKAGAGGGPP